VTAEKRGKDDPRVFSVTARVKIRFEEEDPYEDAIDLQRLCFNLRNAELDLKGRSAGRAVSMKFFKPVQFTAQIFAGGAVFLLGCRTLLACRHASAAVVKCLSRVLPKKIVKYEMKVSSMKACADLRHPVRLEGMYWDQREHAAYEPELFSGLIYRMKEPRVSFLLFVTGKLVMSGSKHYQDYVEALEEFREIAAEYNSAQYIASGDPVVS